MRMLLVILVGCILAGVFVFATLMWFDEDINKAVRQWSGWSVLDARPAVTEFKGKANPDEWTLARQAARQMAGKCENLAKEHCDDTNLLLGVAFIHKYFPDRSCTYEAALKRILEADPCSLPASAMKAEFDTGTWLARVQYDIVSINRVLTSRQISGTSRIKITPDDETVYSLIKPDDAFIESGSSPAIDTRSKTIYYIKDPVAARTQIVERINSRLPDFLEMLDKASAVDPDNGFYDYLKAHLCLEMWQPEKGLEYIKAALNKKTVDNYVEKARGEALAIMRSERYPRVCRDYISLAGNTAGEYVAANICRNWLEEMTRQKRIKGDMTGARELAALTSQVKQQCGIKTDADEPAQ